MTNPTRQEILDAHEELEKLCNRLPGTRRAKMTILAALPPKPQPTMAEVKWDDEKHYLAEAEHPLFGKVIMLGLNVYDQIDFIAPNRYASRYKDAPLEDLTPTGRRYTLTEVQDNEYWPLAAVVRLAPYPHAAARVEVATHRRTRTALPARHSKRT